MPRCAAAAHAACSAPQPLMPPRSGAHPPARSPQFLAPEKLRGCGALLLDAGGRRFVDELATRDRVAAALMALPGRSAWLLLGARGGAAFGEGALGFYASKGLVTKVGVKGSGCGVGLAPGQQRPQRRGGPMQCR